MERNKFNIKLVKDGIGLTNDCIWFGRYNKSRIRLIKYRRFGIKLRIYEKE